ncbi:MAG TPA: hypothetical protein ENG36_02465, partial [Lentisphaerae bacterium]|nr:hypothetical protein [Lentisphaerota bacterium]
IRLAGSSAATLRNNILVADGSDSVCILWAGGSLDSDYNDLVARNGAWIGTCNGYWERLLYWQRESGQDIHSLAAEPHFADEAGGDFHLKSLTGRWTESGWTNDTVHSPCIDTGDPSASYTNETSPNGLRINLGAYGDTPEASRSRTNAWLLVLTGNDGGVLKGTNELRWVAGNLGAGDLVRLDYSPDNGTTWNNITTGLNPLDGEYTWDSSSFASSLQALWRVMSQTNSLIVDVPDSTFALRNVPLQFFINDTNTADDVYCTAAGDAANSGLSNSAPKLSLADLLDTYDVEAQDVIYVDTGIYRLSTNITVIWSRGGDSDYGQMVIRGSTNYAAGGSIFEWNGGGSPPVIDVKASYVTLRDIAIRKGATALRLDSNRYCRVERLNAYSNSVAVVVTNCSHAGIFNCRIWKNSAGGVDLYGGSTAVVENCTFYGNAGFALRSRSAQNNVFQNNIVVVNTTGTTALAGSAYDIFVDYNIYQLLSNATIFSSYQDLQDWQLAYNHDFRSAITNPLLADPEAGDFHLLSSAGRFVDGVGWTNDSQTSWGVDKGNPYSDYSLEPETNGNRVNIGAWGNTEYASKGSTNQTVQTRTLNEATVIEETNNRQPLIWTVINVPTDLTFRVQFSGDGGASWVDLATGVNAYAEYVIWDASSYYNTYKGRWRIVGETDTNYWDVNDSPFEVFFGEFAISDIYTMDDLRTIKWRGAWDEVYQVQYSSDPLNWWSNAVNGTGVYQKANILTTNGGDFIYQDVESGTSTFRWYRVIWEQY